MPSPIILAGFDSRSLAIEAPVLKRRGCEIDERDSASAVLAALAATQAHLLLLGPRLPDLGLVELVRRIRSDPGTRQVSILALLPSSEASGAEAAVESAGANAALRRPLEPQVLEQWLVKLLDVPRRSQIRVPVRGQVVAVPRSGETGRFYGQTRNISVNGLLLASHDALTRNVDVELEVNLEEPARQLRAIGRVVRSATEVAWPYNGYGIEFLLVPPDSQAIIGTLLQGQQPPAVTGTQAPKIRTTVRRESWVYEILDAVEAPHGWQVEIRRAPSERWRPGSGGPFYVVVEASPEAAHRQARAFVERMG
jgi:CheY-like chemotaxis protein